MPIPFGEGIFYVNYIYQFTCAPSVSGLPPLRRRTGRQCAATPRTAICHRIHIPSKPRCPYHGYLRADVATAAAAADIRPARIEGGVGLWACAAGPASSRPAAGILTPAHAPAGALSYPTASKIYIYKTGEMFPPLNYDPEVSPDTAVTVVAGRRGESATIRKTVKPTTVRAAPPCSLPRPSLPLHPLAPPPAPFPLSVFTAVRSAVPSPVLALTPSAPHPFAFRPGATSGADPPRRAAR